MPELSPSISRALLALSPLGRQQRLSILIYHRVMSERDWMRPGEPTVEEFTWQMQLLQRHFNILPLRQAVRKLKQGCLPPRAVCITFDDGYADNATVALPVLKQLDIPATVFVAASYLNGGCMWNDKVIESLRHYTNEELDLSRLGLPVYPSKSKTSRRMAAHDILRRCKYLPGSQREDIADCLVSQLPSLPDNLMLSTDQVLTLQKNGVEIGGHTFSHPILSNLSTEQARNEILQGKLELQAITEQPLYVFAYPNGRPGKDYNQSHVALVEEAGFEAAVSTSWGVATPKSDLLQLPRFTPWDKSVLKFILRMALNGRNVAQAPGEYQC